MAMYYCSRCCRMLDNDWHPCSEDPHDELELVCPDCMMVLEEQAEEALHDEDYRKPKIPFDKTQHFFKMYKTQE